MSSRSESPQPVGGRHLVITVHGIRTFGAWQKRLANLLGPGIASHHYRYGYFSVLAYLSVIFRWPIVNRFKEELLATAAGGWDRIDIVAHSFGTYIVAKAIQRIPVGQRPAIHTIIFAGSVLRPKFRVNDLVGRGVYRLVNDCGIKDHVLVANQLFVLLSGLAGRLGFMGMETPSLLTGTFRSGIAVISKKTPKALTLWSDTGFRSLHQTVTSSPSICVHLPR